MSFVNISTVCIVKVCLTVCILFTVYFVLISYKKKLLQSLFIRTSAQSVPAVSCLPGSDFTVIRSVLTSPNGRCTVLLSLCSASNLTDEAATYSICQKSMGQTLESSFPTANI